MTRTSAQRRNTGRVAIRNQQVSGSSPLAGSNRLNNLQRSRVQTDPTRVTTVSPPIRRWIGLATPTPRRSTNSSGQPAHSTRGQPSPPPDRCGTDRRSPASLKASDTNQPPAAEAWRQDAVVSDGHARSVAALAGPHAGSLLPIRRTGRRLHYERIFAIHRPHSPFRVYEAPPLPSTCSTAAGRSRSSRAGTRRSASRFRRPRTAAATVGTADDERKLSHSTSASVAGPVGISVDDAQVQEAAGAVLTLAVALSPGSRPATSRSNTPPRTSRSRPGPTARRRAAR